MLNEQNMSKFLIILLLLAGSSLFAVEAFALEVEIQKESDRIIESRGWLTPEIHSFQEQFQIIIDHATPKTITPSPTILSAISREFFLISSKLSPNPSLVSSIMTHPRSV